jgi:hypothetical protein
MTKPADDWSGLRAMSYGIYSLHRMLTTSSHDYRALPVYLKSPELPGI